MEIIPRRPLDDNQPDGYLESDRDFVLNNLNMCVQLLEARLHIEDALSAAIGFISPCQNEEADELASMLADVLNSLQRR